MVRQETINLKTYKYWVVIRKWRIKRKGWARRRITLINVEKFSNFKRW